MVFLGVHGCNGGMARGVMAGVSELESTMKAVSRLLMIGAFAVGTLAFAGAAQAGSDLSWSLTVGTPGVVVGVMPPAPVYYGAPVYVQPYPVYRGQRHRHYQPYHHYRPRHRAHGARHLHRHGRAGPRHGYRAAQRRHHHAR